MNHRERWETCTAQATGSAHRKGGIPNQDAVLSGVGIHPWVVACDGRGSAARSELGAQAGAEAFGDFVAKNGGKIDDILGSGRSRCATRPKRWRDLVQAVLWPRLQATLAGLSKRHGLDPAEFEYTFSGAVVGPRFIGWVQLGDSGLVRVNGFRATLLSPFAKGEFANQTCFVGPGSEALQQLRCGITPAGPTRALYAFTDGIVPQFFDLRTGRPGMAFSQLARQLAGGHWTQRTLEGLLHLPVWKTCGDDDRSLAIIYRAKHGKMPG